MKDLIKEFKDYAMEHYDDPDYGFDYVVECWSDENIAEVIDGAKNLKEAIDKASTALSYFRDIEATAW